MKKLYLKLRRIVSNRFAIILTDENFRGNAEVTISPKRNSHPWTSFEGKSLKEALEKAIQKCMNPDSDYVDSTGYIWKATESSIYENNYIKLFLRNKKAEIVGVKAHE